MSGDTDREREPSLEAFLGEPPPRRLGDWTWFWNSGLSVPPRRGGRLRRLVVRVAQRLLRPIARVLSHEQRLFNLVLISHLEELQGLYTFRDDIIRDLNEVRTDLLRDVQNNHGRISNLEGFQRNVVEDVNRHTDALFSRVDQKFDRYRRESRELWAKLGAVLTGLEAEGTTGASRALAERDYVDLEQRMRGTEEEIGKRVSVYTERLRGRGTVLDLGCGRGEALAILGEAGIDARGVDASAEMVRHCRDKGLAAEAGDMLEFLAAVPEGSLGGVISLHVIEHLDSGALPRLARLARRSLAPGGLLILETPNPLSLAAGARNFWRDPTHRRPVHPETLALLLSTAGFEPVETLELSPFGASERLPEIDVGSLDGEADPMTQYVLALRDHLDGLLYGFQDYALIGERPAY